MMIDKGSGPALVLIPGLPGPWQFFKPAVDELAKYFRVLTLSLGPECTLDADAARIIAGLNKRGIDRAAICGVSLGGLIALRFAATHQDRTAALVLASTPGPGFTLRPRHRLYTRWPWIFGPLFVLESPFNLRHELHWSQFRALLSAPVSFAKIARRAQLIEATDIAADCAKVTAPTLVVTGERAFDHVVSVDSTLEYLRAIPQSTHVELKSTGHLGSVMRPHEFTAMVRTFVGDPERVAPRTDSVESESVGRPFQGRQGAA